MSPAALPLAVSPAPAPTPGVCRVCGCTDGYACWLAVRLGANGGLYPTERCSWVEQDLCSRCWGPHRPTRLQAGEIARIRDRQGPVEIRRGRKRFELELTLVRTRDVGEHFVIRPTVLFLDREGRVTQRLDCEVIQRDEPRRAYTRRDSW